MEPPPHRRIVLIIAAAVAITWFPTWDEPYAEDDFLYLEAHVGADWPTLLGYLVREGVMDHHYRPLADPFFFAMLDRTSGLNPVGYHFALLSCLTLTGILLFYLALQLQLSVPAAALAALIYVSRDFSYPSLVWASGFSDIGSALLGLASVAAFVRWLNRGRARDRALAVVLFGLALVTKETVIALVGLYPLVWVYLRGIPSRTRGSTHSFGGLLRATVPFLALGMPLTAIQLTRARFDQAFGEALFAWHPGFDSFLIWPAYAVWSVIGVRELVAATGLFTAVVVSSYAGLAGWAAIGVRGARRRTSRPGILGLGIGWFFIAIAPLLLAPSRALTNYVAIAAVGPCLVLGTALASMGGAGRPLRRRIAWALAAVILGSGPLLVHLKDRGRIHTGGWVSSVKAREMNRVVEALVSEVLPDPAPDGRLLVFGATAYDIRVLGDPRGRGFGGKPLLASALRVHYGRKDLEVWSLPRVDQLSAVTLTWVHGFFRDRPAATYLITTTGSVHDRTRAAADIIARNGGNRALRRALRGS